jgi:hypothetical protein
MYRLIYFGDKLLEIFTCIIAIFPDNNINLVGNTITTITRIKEKIKMYQKNFAQKSRPQKF